MRTVLITPATFQPMEVDEIKLRPELRISGTDDDLTISAMLQSAINAYEDYTGHILCRSTWECISTSGRRRSKHSRAARERNFDNVSRHDRRLADIRGSKIHRGHDRARSWGAWHSPTANPGRRYTTRSTRSRYVSLQGYADPSDIPSRVKDGLLFKIQELYDGVDRSAAYEGCWMADRRIPV